MKRTTARATARAKRKSEKERGMHAPGGESDYSRKHRWLARSALWGWEVSEPKPWKRGLRG